MGQAYSAPQLKFSGKHNGFALYISRLIRPFYNSTISQLQKHHTTYKCRWTVNQLTQLESACWALRRYCCELNNRFASETGLGFREQASASNVRQRVANFYTHEAEKREERSFQGLVAFLGRVVEAVSLIIELIHGDMLNKVLNKMKEETRARAVKLTFRDLVLSKESFATTQALVSGLIGLHKSDDPSGVAAIIRTLSDKCPCKPLRTHSQPSSPATISSTWRA